MSTVDTVRSVISHRGMSCLELHRLLGELQRKVRQLAPRAEQATAMEARIDEQALTIDSLREQLAEAKTVRAEANAKATRFDEAEARATEVGRMLAAQTKELLALRAFRDNVNSITPLPRHQAPASPPADRFETGMPVRLGVSPLAVTDPGQAPVMANSSTVDTQPIPLAVQPETAAT